MRWYFHVLWEKRTVLQVLYFMFNLYYNIYLKYCFYLVYLSELLKHKILLAERNYFLFMLHLIADYIAHLL